MRRKSGFSGLARKARVGAGALFFAVAALSGLPAAVATDVQAIHDAALNATVRVRAHGFVASGFWYGDSDRQLITNLHAVLPRQGKQSTRIEVKCGDYWDSAKVVKVLQDADLVLLETERLTWKDMGCQPLTRLSLTPPQPKEKLDLFGYRPENDVTPFQKETVKQSMRGDETLERIVDDNLRESVRRLGIPDATLPLYYVGSGLYPGFSGGPVINSSGALVGVVDGGLDNGLKSHAWVIPASNIQRLMASNTSTPPDVVLKPEYGIGFSGEMATLPENSTVVMQPDTGAPYEFVYIKTRSMADLLMTADPADGLREVLDAVLPDIETDAEMALAFDIYQELDLGLIVAVPRGSSLQYQQEGDFLMLEESDDSAVFLIKHERAPQFAGAQQLSHEDLVELAMDTVNGCDRNGGEYVSCVVDESLVRTLDYGADGKVVRFGYTETDLRTGEQTYYYDSIVIRGEDLFYIEAAIDFTEGSAVAECLAQQTASACGRRYWDAAALMLATQLTTVDSMESALEASAVVYGASDYIENDSEGFQESGASSTGNNYPADARVSYLAPNGVEAFVWVDGTGWLVNIGGQLAEAVETYRWNPGDGSDFVNLQY